MADRHGSRTAHLARALVAAVVLTQAVALWHELEISRVDRNDNVLHYTLIERMTDALRAGQNPLDLWVPEWSLGYPVTRTYQPLGQPTGSSASSTRATSGAERVSTPRASGWVLLVALVPETLI